MSAAECIIVINGRRLVAKIIWKGGSKFQVIECEDKNYVNSIVDASDVLRCIIN